jgi:hypothetical protein
MARIWTFGDSFTASFKPEPPITKIVDWRNEYCEFKGYIPEVYGEVISRILDIPLMNMGLGGSDNYTILDTIIDSCDIIKEDDIIIVGWSSVLRYRLVNRNGIFRTLIPNSSKTNQVEFFDVKQSTIDDLLVNRSHVNYIKELNKFINLVNHLFPKTKIIQWSPFYSWANNEGVNVQKINIDIMGINRETKNTVSDGHFSEQTHKDLAHKMIEILDKGGSISKKLL